MFFSRRASSVALGVAATLSNCGHPVSAFYSPGLFKLLPLTRESLAGSTVLNSIAERTEPCYVRRRRSPGRWGSAQKVGLGVKADSMPRDERCKVFMVPEDKAATAQSADGIIAFLPNGVQEELTRVSNDPAKLNFVLNTVVVLLFASFAAFKLATVDLDISRGWTWYEILLRVPGDNFYRYEATVSENPIITKALTSCVAYGLGDLTAQFFTGKDLETIDLWRTSRSATAGLLVHGPLCHFWIQLMQTYLDFDGAWWAFIPKVVADQTVWSIFLNAAYSTMIMSLQGKSPPQVWGEVKSTAWPALTSSWRFWPLIHCVSFSNLIPTDLKLLFIDCMEIIWVTILSTVANKDREGSDGEGGNDMDTGKPVEETDGALTTPIPSTVLLEREPVVQ